MLLVTIVMITLKLSSLWVLIHDSKTTKVTFTTKPLIMKG